jgi:hypothetical protein
MHPSFGREGALAAVQGGRMPARNIHHDEVRLRILVFDPQQQKVVRWIS